MDDVLLTDLKRIARAYTAEDAPCKDAGASADV